MEKRVKIELTKRGFPAMWEKGGGFSNTGEATIICSSDGRPKKAVYIRRKGHLANAEHALVVLEKGDFVIEAFQWREDFTIVIYKVKDFKTENTVYTYYEQGEEKVGVYESHYAVLEEVNCFDNGEWDKEVSDYLEPAIHSAMGKACCYHCREAHYVISDEN